MQPNETTTNCLTVVTTATLELHLDGTWSVIAFGPNKRIRHPKQTFLNRFNRNKKKIKELGKKKEKQEEPEPEFKTADWYLKNANKIRKQAGGPEGHSKHCSKCGMTGVNKQTCLTVIDMHGRMLQGRKHRKTGGWL